MTMAPCVIDCVYMLKSSCYTFVIPTRFEYVFFLDKNQRKVMFLFNVLICFPFVCSVEIMPYTSFIILHNVKFSKFIKLMVTCTWIFAKSLGWYRGMQGKTFFFFFTWILRDPTCYKVNVLVPVFTFSTYSGICSLSLKTNIDGRKQSTILHTVKKNLNLYFFA